MGMSLKNLEIIRVDDIPVLLAMISEMNIQHEIDRHIHPHGLWQGISVGTIVTIWLCYILTEQDHRLEPVQEWVNQRQRLFNELLGIQLRDTDMSDDRLANVLTMLGTDTVQSVIDQALNQHWITLYELPTEIKRFDSTTIAVYQDIKEDEDSIIGHGYSKDHRPDLAQFKVMLSTLDMGLPLTCQVVNGKRADDGLYIPAYDSVIETTGHTRFLAVGDSKMAAKETRSHISQNGSWYLCPYRGTAAKGENIAGWIEAAIQKYDQLEEVKVVNEETGELSRLATVDEWSRWQTLSSATGEEIRWLERVVVAHSPSYQQGMLTRRLRHANQLDEALERLRQPPGRGRKRYKTKAELDETVANLMRKHRMEGLVTIEVLEETCADGGIRWIVGRWKRNQQAWDEMTKRLGWQIYVTSLPQEAYPTAEVIHIYRRQPHLERSISRLKSRTLHIRPIFLHKEERIIGLTWILVLALRFIVLMEFRVRRELVVRKEVLYGLKASSPNSGTTKPTTEKMLEAFSNISWTIITLDEETTHYHVTPLSDTQIHILKLLNLSSDIYERLSLANPKPLVNLLE